MAGPDFDPRAVPIRPAATVMLLRDVKGGVEVFMLRRTSKAAFAGGMYVFPGGRVDEADSAAEIEPYCEGLDDEAASSLLGVERGGLAYWVAAIRECLEEAGGLVGTRRSGGDLSLGEDIRHAVHDGELSMVELCRRHDLVLDAGAVSYVTHWVTPLGERRRFDTRFFIAAMPPDQQPVHDDTETVASQWIRPHDALDAMRAGELMLLPPTIANLGSLLPYTTTADVLQAASEAGPAGRIEPRLRLDEHGNFLGVSLPGDPDYASLA